MLEIYKVLKDFHLVGQNGAFAPGNIIVLESVSAENLVDKGVLEVLI